MENPQQSTMEEIALKIWALRTGQEAGQLAVPTGESPNPLRLTQLTLPQEPCEGRAAN